MSQLSTNTTLIDECISIANTLPDAGGGGTGSIETCSVQFQEMGNLLWLLATRYTGTTGDAEPYAYYYSIGGANTVITISDVPKGSILFAVLADSADWECTNATLVGENFSTTEFTYVYQFRITGNATIVQA